jgi:hypothetical protein
MHDGADPLEVVELVEVLVLVVLVEVPVLVVLVVLVPVVVDEVVVPLVVPDEAVAGLPPDPLVAVAVPLDALWLPVGAPPCPPVPLWLPTSQPRTQGPKAAAPSTTRAPIRLPIMSFHLPRPTQGSSKFRGRSL